MPARVQLGQTRDALPHCGLPAKFTAKTSWFPVDWKQVSRDFADSRGTETTQNSQGSIDPPAGLHVTVLLSDLGLKVWGQLRRSDPRL